MTAATAHRDTGSRNRRPWISRVLSGRDGRSAGTSRHLPVRTLARTCCRLRTRAPSWGRVPHGTPAPGGTVRVRPVVCTYPPALRPTPAERQRAANLMSAGSSVGVALYGGTCRGWCNEQAMWRALTRIPGDALGPARLAQSVSTTAPGYTPPSLRDRIAAVRLGGDRFRRARWAPARQRTRQPRTQPEQGGGTLPGEGPDPAAPCLSTAHRRPANSGGATGVPTGRAPLNRRLLRRPRRRDAARRDWSRCRRPRIVAAATAGSAAAGRRLAGDARRLSAPQVAGRTRLPAVRRGAGSGGQALSPVAAPGAPCWTAIRAVRSCSATAARCGSPCGGDGKSC